MKTFGNELRRIREREGMTQAKFSEQLRINPSTYYAVESGTMSAQTNSAKRILQSNALSQEDKQQLGKFSRQEIKGTIKITEAQRLDYRRRRNAEYQREMAK